MSALDDRRPIAGLLTLDAAARELMRARSKPPFHLLGRHTAETMIAEMAADGRLILCRSDGSEVTPPLRRGEQLDYRHSTLIGRGTHHHEREDPWMRVYVRPPRAAARRPAPELELARLARPSTGGLGPTSPAPAAEPGMIAQAIGRIGAAVGGALGRIRPEPPSRPGAPPPARPPERAPAGLMTLGEAVAAVRSVRPSWVGDRVEHELRHSFLIGRLRLVDRDFVPLPPGDEPLDFGGSRIARRTPGLPMYLSLGADESMSIEAPPDDTGCFVRADDLRAWLAPTDPVQAPPADQHDEPSRVGGRPPDRDWHEIQLTYVARVLAEGRPKTKADAIRKLGELFAGDEEPPSWNTLARQIDTWWKLLSLMPAAPEKVDEPQPQPDRDP